MSAFMVNKTHLDYLITAGLRYTRHGALSWFAPAEEPPEETTHQRGQPWGPGAVAYAATRRRELTAETADRVGAMLAAENRRSVDHRYNEDELEEFYTFTRYPGSGERGSASRPTLDPIQVLKAISCYEYQSCEHPEWEQSEAHDFCRVLRHTVVAALPGYDEAAWEIPPIEGRKKA
mgnify:CR=1 FL=1